MRMSYLQKPRQRGKLAGERLKTIRCGRLQTGSTLHPIGLGAVADKVDKVTYRIIVEQNAIEYNRILTYTLRAGKIAISFYVFSIKYKIAFR